jgi:hypothetical protein
MIEDIIDDSPEEFGTGWYEDPESVEKVVETLPFPVFGDTEAATLSIEDVPEEMLGWRLWSKATGGSSKFPELNQGSVGSCVGHGTVGAIHYSMSAEICAGQAEQCKPLCPEIAYAGGRVEIGKSRLGFRDGCIGAWSAKFTVEYGNLARGKYLSKYDFTEYNAAKCRQLGTAGVPNDLEPILAEHKITSITKITNFHDAVLALAQGYGIQVASSQGFSSMRRDKEGYCPAQGRWMHSMCFVGYRRTGRTGLFCLNSWGTESTTGPKSHEDAPSAGWWVDEETCDKMLSQGDSWAFAGLNGFASRKIDWF